MPHHHDRFVIGKSLVESIQVVAQERRRIRIGISARISEEPELIAFRISGSSSSALNIGIHVAEVS